MTSGASRAAVQDVVAGARLCAVCCADDDRLDLPPAVLEMVARYRRMRAEQGVGWGEDPFPEMFRWARFSRLGPAFAEFSASGDWAGAVRAAVGDTVPAGLALVAVTDGGLDVRTGPPRPVVPGATVEVDVVLDSSLDRDVVVEVDGEDVPVPAGGAGLATVDARGPIAVTFGDARLDVVATVPAAAATLLLTTTEGARWSVTDATGGAWFADGVPHKWAADDRPFFHTDPGTVALTVPAGPLHVVAARGPEFARAEWHLHPAAGERLVVDYAPGRRFDPAGWHGGDLHVHLNYSGDHVLEPADARRMQVGEGLAVMQLAAGNLTGPLVYDRELLAATAGKDLWSGSTVARAGLEFRNALLGHVHGLGLTGVPELLHTGDEGTDHPWDWPPNAVACDGMQDLHAVTTYAHPVYAPDGDGPDELFRPYRMVEARELVADAALGVVDAVELASCFDDHGALVLYHHLLSCGLRLAAVAGTDAFLSFARGPAPASNPPGWCRVYARGDGPPSVEGFAAAIRAGATLVTNGPWLTFAVDGAGPGAVLARIAGDRLRVRATAVGGERLVLYGPDGVLATGEGVVEHEVTVDAGTWLAAAAHGAPDPYTLGAPAFAHTTPVYVDAGGRRVARAASARFCLRLLDGLQELAAEQGRFDPDDRGRQVGDLVAVLDRARAFYRAVAEQE